MYKYIYKTGFFIIFSLIISSSFGQINHPMLTRLTEGWLFLRGDIGNIWEAVRPSGPGLPEEVPLWTPVVLPHCFNAEDAVDPYTNYYQGPGWYKTQLNLDNPFDDGRTLLHFEGAGQKSEVYVYMEKVAVHIGGYDEWSVDITDAVDRFLASPDAARFKGKVPISIRCDNSRNAEMIPSNLADFNLYGGLYRYVNLVYTPALTLSSLQTTASVDNQGQVGRVDIAVDLDNHSDMKEAVLTIEILNPEENCFKRKIEKISKPRGKYFFSFEVLSPKLWSTEVPMLYTCRVTLVSKAGTMSWKERFGFRHFEFKEKGPFYLNGKRLLLKGTHRHEDHAGVGAAMTEELIEREMKLMKEMGVNFIRLGHYQQSRIVLNLCDQLGILVWEEIPWCRGGLGGTSYQKQAQNMLTNMITQHRNHPSIILWGLGNENDWPNDFPVFDKQRIRNFMQQLHNLAHSLDNSRLTCIRRCDFCKDIVDVYSPSIWAGWYRGVYSDYRSISWAEMKKVRHFLHVEWGGDSHTFRHAENPYADIDSIQTGAADERTGDASLYGGTKRVSKDGDWSETYVCDLIDWHLKEQEKMSWLTGTAYWPFKDFSTPLRPENPIPYVNQKGVVERDLTPKESYYVFQSYWSDSPMIHIYGHSWATRWGKNGESKTVKVYSNCSEVELFLNGKSLGIKKRNSQDFPAAGLRWEVKFAPGKNNLHAIVRDQGVTLDDEVQFYYETRSWGEPTNLILSTESESDRSIWVTATLKDKNGVTCLDARNFISFEIAGDCILHANLGTSTGSKKVQAYNGRARIKVTKTGPQAVIAVKSDKLETAILSLP